jgi:hypothetical protein
MRTNKHLQQASAELDLVGIVCQNAHDQTSSVVFRHSDMWTKLTIGQEATSTVVDDDVTSDNTIKFALYRREVC